jgi:hypothetical protein
MTFKTGFAPRLSAAVVCVLLAGVLEAQAPKYGVAVNVDDKKADFASFKTYAWQRGQASFDKAVDTQIVASVDQPHRRRSQGQAGRRRRSSEVSRRHAGRRVPEPEDA